MISLELSLFYHENWFYKQVYSVYLYKIPTENAQTHMKKKARKRPIRRATNNTLSPMVRITTCCEIYGTYNHRKCYV